MTVDRIGLLVSEADGTPGNVYIYKLVLPNGTVTITSNIGTLSIPVVSDTAYDESTWDANTDAATKNAIRDKIESVVSSIENLEAAVYKTEYIPIAAMTPTTTNGAEAGSNEYATNDKMKDYFAFDTATEIHTKLGRLIATAKRKAAKT